MDKLEGRIRNHDREIEKMCNHHFQGFVDSITELLKVRAEAQKLKVRRRVGEVLNEQDGGRRSCLPHLASVVPVAFCRGADGELVLQWVPLLCL